MDMHLRKLENKAAIITGGAGSIGRTGIGGESSNMHHGHGGKKDETAIGSGACVVYLQSSTPNFYIIEFKNHLNESKGNGY